MMIVITMMWAIAEESGRKQKSYSSAAEMLRFLQSFTERRKNAEEEKIKL